MNSKITLDEIFCLEILNCCSIYHFYIEILKGNACSEHFVYSIR